MLRAKFVEVIRDKYLANTALTECERIEAYDAMFHTGSMLIEHFSSHDSILVSVSGGSDSDCIVHLICTYFPEYVEKCCFVFVNTGLEFKATKSHLNDIERRYGIQVHRIRGESVVTAVHKFGIPILSKRKSEEIGAYLRGQPSALKKVMQLQGRYGYTDEQRRMIAYIQDNGIKISAMCCDHSKKKPLKRYIKQHNIDLNVTGERKSEGGMRASAHKSCFEHQKHIDKFMPLWWWTDGVKAVFKRTENIKYSDCYEVYGMRRTGCAGCPFNLNIADELQAMHEYEPGLFNACMSVFGRSYELMDRFNCRRKKCLPDSFQITLK